MKKETNLMLFVGLIILLTAFMRVFNAELHLYHLVPVASLGLFSGSILQQKKWAYMIPLVAMLLSDIGLSLFTSTQGFYGISQIVNYAAIALVTFMGTFLVKRNAINIIGFTLSGSLVFFILSNLGTFLGGYYGYSFNGFITCFTMAIPFYKSEMANTFFLNSFAGDMLFSLVAFGLMHIWDMQKAKIKLA